MYIQIILSTQCTVSTILRMDIYMFASTWYRTVQDMLQSGFPTSYKFTFNHFNLQTAPGAIEGTKDPRSTCQPPSQCRWCILVSHLGHSMCWKSEYHRKIHCLKNHCRINVSIHIIKSNSRTAAFKMWGSVGPKEVLRKDRKGLASIARHRIAGIPHCYLSAIKNS